MNFFDTVRNLKESQSPGEIAHEVSADANASSAKGDHSWASIHHNAASIEHNKASSLAQDKNLWHYHSIMATHHSDLSNFHQAASQPI